jgi:hypothetical protein
LLLQDLFWHMQRSNSSTGKQPLLRAGWLAFLLIKSQLLPGFPDLVRCVACTAAEDFRWRDLFPFTDISQHNLTCRAALKQCLLQEVQLEWPDQQQQQKKDASTVSQH